MSLVVSVTEKCWLLFSIFYIIMITRKLVLLNFKRRKVSKHYYCYWKDQWMEKFDFVSLKPLFMLYVLVSGWTAQNLFPTLHSVLYEKISLTLSCLPCTSFGQICFKSSCWPCEPCKINKLVFLRNTMLSWKLY